MKKSKSKQQAVTGGTNSETASTSDEKLTGSGGQELDEIELEDEDYDDFDEFMVEHRPSLPPPTKPGVTWSEYITADESRWPYLGRKVRCKESRKEFKAQLAMVSPRYSRCNPNRKKFLLRRKLKFSRIQ